MDAAAAVAVFAQILICECGEEKKKTWTLRLYTEKCTLWSSWTAMLPSKQQIWYQFQSIFQSYISFIYLFIFSNGNVRILVVGRSAKKTQLKSWKRLDIKYFWLWLLSHCFQRHTLLFYHHVRCEFLRITPKYQRIRLGKHRIRRQQLTQTVLFSMCWLRLSLTRSISFFLSICRFYSKYFGRFVNVLLQTKCESVTRELSK